MGTGTSDTVSKGENPHCVGVASLGLCLLLLEDVEVQLLPSVVDILPSEKLG